MPTAPVIFLLRDDPARKRSLINQGRPRFFRVARSARRTIDKIDPELLQAAPEFNRCSKSHPPSTHRSRKCARTTVRLSATRNGQPLRSRDHRVRFFERARRRHHRGDYSAAYRIMNHITMRGVNSITRKPGIARASRRAQKP